MIFIKKPLIAIGILFGTISSYCLLDSYRPGYTNEKKGFYITSSLGNPSTNKPTWKATVSDIDYKGDLSIKEAYGWEGGVGYDFGQIRTEFTYSKSNNDIQSISAQVDEGVDKGDSAEANASGSFNIENIFLSSYFDINLGRQNIFFPYLGGGVGVSRMNIDYIMVADERLFASNIWLFGYQAKIGLNFLLNKQIDIFGEADYKGFSDLAVAGDKYGLDSNSDINYRVGFRFKL